MPSVTIQQAKASLGELIHGLSAGAEVVITEDDRPVARLIAVPAQPAGKPRQLGTLRGTVLFIADDFDAPLSDFGEYAT